MTARQPQPPSDESRVAGDIPDLGDAETELAHDDEAEAAILAELEAGLARPPLPDGLPLSVDRPTLVCFDLDGCLIDSDDAFTSALNGALAAHDLPQLPPEHLRWAIGPPLQDAVSQLLDELLADPGLAEPIIASYRANYRREAVERTAVHKSVLAVAQRIGRPHTVGVVTSKPFRIAVPLMDSLGLRRTFSFVVGPDLSSGEPKTETLARAIELHADERPTVMIGDRLHDVHAGREHGATTIGVLWGNGSRRELAEAKPDVLCEDAYDLAEALLTGRFQPPEADE